jgi:hypothetical protein
MNYKGILLVLVFFIIPFCAASNNITLNYILNGEVDSIDFTVNEGVADYLENLPQAIRYELGEIPSRADFAIRNIDEPNQREVLLPLVEEIKSRAINKEDQMRIAVSIVQNIPYGESGKNVSFGGAETGDLRYPYEVLYNNQGLCGEKSELLLFLLKELGYETSFFYFPMENHEAVGIKCPKWKSFKGTGQCFIETTGPAIITDSSIEYVGGITLQSEPEIYFISEGDSLPWRLYEYNDAKKMRKIRENKFTFFNKQKKMEELEQKYGLVEEYNLE